MVECLHSALKTIAVRLLNVLVPRPTHGETEPVGPHIGLWTFVSGDKLIDTANCQECSNI